MSDAKDRKIIDALIDNSRQSFREVAKKLGISVVTVMKHVKKLEKDRIIEGYTAMVDYDKLGYDIDVLVNIKVAHGKYEEVYNRLKNHPDILALYDVTGDFDAVIVAKFKNRRLLDSFLKKLQVTPYIERTNTVFILKTLERKGIKLG